MSPTTVLVLQSALIALQLVNAGLATIPHLPPQVPLIVSAALGGFQFFVTHVGNQIVPPAK